MDNQSYKKLIRRIYMILCMAAAAASAALLWYWNIGVGWTRGFFGTQTLVVVSLLYCTVYFLFAKTYRAFDIGKYRLTELAFSQALSFAFSDLTLLVAAFFWFHNFRRIHISYFVLALFLQCVLMTLVIFAFNRWHMRHDGPRRIVIVYGDDNYKSLVKKMKAHRNRYDIRACLKDTEKKEVLLEAIDLSEDTYLCSVRGERKNELIRYCRDHAIKYHISIEVDDLLLMECDVSHYFDTPFLKSRSEDTIWYYPFLKRFADIAASLVILVLLSPVMLITAAAIKIEDGGSVFYKQKRLTRGRTAFMIYKFRSMRENSEDHAVLAAVDDDRITRVGRVIRACRIDELPQAINILKGDMSLVGPRPERPEIAREYEKTFPDFALRLRVKAGLTGYAQVYGKYNTSPEDKLKMDLLYITHRSVFLDLRLLFYTIKILFNPESTEGVER